MFLLSALLPDFSFLCQYNKSFLDTIDAGDMTQGKVASDEPKKKKKGKLNVLAQSEPNGIHPTFID